ncbi:MAG: hypothetical protein ACHQD8_01335 [Chitinophagales bacterium]
MNYSDEIYYSQSPYYQAQENGLTLREVLQYSLLGIIVTGGAIIIGSKMIHKGQARSEQKKTLEDGSIPTYAKQIKMAFANDGWWGTNKTALRQTLRNIPDKSDFKKVMASYQRLYNSSLLSDMQKGLKSTEYNEMLAIVSAKPERFITGTIQPITDRQLQEWAKRLKAAFDITYGPFPGTDEAAIKAVFLEIPSQGVFQQVSAAYKTMYGNDLSADLKSELEFWEYSPMMQLISDKPNN